MTLQLYTLGGFSIRLHDATPPELASQKERALLVYLALSDQPHSRSQIAGVFWEGKTEAEARMNLRRAVSNLRAAIGPALESTRQTLMIVPGAIEVDALEFEQRIQLARTSDRSHAERELSAAADLYRGPFLDGFDIKNAPLFDEWAAARSEQLRRLGVYALHQIATLATQRRDYLTATDATTRLLLLDPWLEDAHQLMMLVLAEQGERGAALRQFEICRARLKEEFGIEPSREMVLLHERIRSDDSRGPSQVVGGRHTTGSTQRTVGRRAEWEELLGAWNAALTGARMVVLRGKPGIGKTRLVYDLMDWTSRRGGITAHAACFDITRDLAFVPVKEWLRSSAFAPAIDSLEEPWRVALSPLLPELSVASMEDPGQPFERERLFDALAHVVKVVSADPSGHGPLVLAVDDLHWSDDDTLVWLHHLLRSCPDSQLLVVATLRQRQARSPILESLLASLRRMDRLVGIDVSELSRGDAAELATRVSERPITTTQALHLHRRTMGNPQRVIQLVNRTRPSE